MTLNLLFYVLLFHQVFNIQNINAQRTILDEQFGHLYRPLRLLAQLLAGPSSSENNLKILRRAGKLQNSNLLTKFCDAKNGPGKRSFIRPNSVHRLRPGDIDVIGAIGDSLTAGTGVFATKLFHNAVENRGVVFSIGGQSNWRKYLTIPNLLKEFNSNLYGYSLGDGLASDRISKFNVAEFGAMSRDVHYEAQILLKRMVRDPRVNMSKDWKLVTLFIGSNDFCIEICQYPNPEDAIRIHEVDMIKTYRFLRDNMPRLMLNIIPVPNLLFASRYVGLLPHCPAILTALCPCIYRKNKKYLDYYGNLLKRWVDKEFEISARREFNTDNFTINVQPFILLDDIPKFKNGKTDLRYLSEDCFHLSQKGQSLVANGYWNNLFEPTGKKSILKNGTNFGKLLCPTEKYPYIMTRTNSQKNFK